MRDVPIRSRQYLDQIEARRKDLGLTQTRAASHFGSDRYAWRQVVSGTPRTGSHHRRSAFDVIAALADAVGLTFVLVPIDGGEVPASAPRVERLRVTSSEVQKSAEVASEHSRTFMRWLREAREERKIKQEKIRLALGIGENRFRAIEYGEREPTLDMVIRYVGQLGLTLAPMTPEAAAFAGLDGVQASAVRRLVVSYVNHCVRQGKSIPPGLLDAAEVLDQSGMMEEEMAA